MDNKQDRFRKLLEPEYIGAMMFCRKLMADRDIGDDLYQDALVNAYTKFGDLRDDSSFKPWLYRIIMNTSKSKTRLKLPKLFKSIDKIPELNLISKDPTDQYTAQRWLKYAFQFLSPKEKGLIVLYELEEWNIREIAELFNKPESSIKQHLFRIRNKMKKCLMSKMDNSKPYSFNLLNLKKENRCAVVKPDSK
ncbi:MAG: RNA polymerase sigma factor [bacterium]